MDNTPFDKDPGQVLQMLLLGAVTFLSLFLMLLNRLSDWEVWMLPVLAACMLLCWTLQLGHVSPAGSGVYASSAALMLEAYYYAIKNSSLYETGALFVVLIVLFVFTAKKPLWIAGLLTEYAGMLCHLILAKQDGRLFLNSTEALRIVLQFVYILLAAMLANRVISIVRQREQSNRQERMRAASKYESLRRLLFRISSLASAGQAGSRLAVRLEDIRDFAGIDAEQVVVTKTPYRITSLLENVLAEIGVLCDAVPDIIVDLDSAIPEQLQGDGDKIQKIIRHLVLNGCQAAPGGGVYVRISQVKRPYGINLVIEVEDTGHGIGEEELEQVYDRLFRSDSEGGESSDKFGLGLAITNGFVQAMGGVLHIDSIPDEGTKVTVSIPQETASEHGCLVLEDADSLAPAGFFGFLILPNPRVRDYYMRMITHLGEGWSIAFSRVTALKDLKEWLKSAPLTHLFVGTSEYLGNKDYIDRLAETVNVALIRDVVFAGEVGENITIISKPFFGIQIADFLNSSRITAKSAAEPPEEASEESEKGYDGLPTVAGLDCAQGLTYCMDDEAFYLEVLWEYANGYEEKVTDLARAFADRNWELYTIKVHAIKSTSQMIGAEELYEQARALEMAASQPDEPFLKEHHPGFLSAYEALVKDLFVALNRNETDAAVEPPAETLEFFDFFPAGGDDE